MNIHIAFIAIFILIAILGIIQLILNLWLLYIMIKCPDRFDSIITLDEINDLKVRMGVQ